MNKQIKGAALTTVFAAFLISGCSSDSTPAAASSSSNSISETNATVRAKTEAITSASSAQAFLYGAIGVAPAFGDGWNTTAHFLDIRDSTAPNVTLKAHMVNTLNPLAVNTNSSAVNMFGRMRSAIEIFCALGQILPASSFGADGYPTNATHTVALTSTLASSAKTTCNIDLTSFVGKNIVVVVTDPVDTTHYDKKLMIDLSDIDPGSSPQPFYFRKTASAVNVAMSESNSQGQSRTVVHVDLTNDKTRAEYISDGAVTPSAMVCGTDNYWIYSYRLYYDGVNDEGHLLSSQSQCNNTNNVHSSERFVMAAKPKTTGGSYSLSMIHFLVGDAGVREACIKNDGASMTDGARCVASSTALNGAIVTDADAILLTLIVTNSGTNPQTWHASFGDTTAPGFTNATDMLTNNFVP